MVSSEGLSKFKGLYAKRYGVELNEKEVFEKANQLLNFYRAVFKEPTDIKINMNYEQKIRSEEN